MTGGEALAWPCGYCRAPAGQQCQTLSGRPVRANRSHGDRAESVRLWKRYGGNGVDTLVTAIRARAVTR